MQAYILHAKATRSLADAIIKQYSGNKSIALQGNYINSSIYTRHETVSECQNWNIS